MKLFMTAALLLLSLSMTAQTTTEPHIKGTVTDTNHEPMAGAQVTLVMASDSTRKFLAATDEQGAFCLQVARGKYALRISYVGCHDLTSTVDCQADTDLKELVMSEDAQMLDEVTVTARRVTYNAKGYSANIVNEKLFRNNTLTETLTLLPGFSDRDGKLKVYQQDILSVFINNRKQRLPIDDVMRLLGTMDSKDIRTIEVLNSTADPEVSTQMGYVVKITTKTIDDGGQLMVGATDNIGNTRANELTPWFSVQQRSGRWSLYVSPRWTPRSELRRSQKSATVYSDENRRRDERNDMTT